MGQHRGLPSPTAYEVEILSDKLTVVIIEDEAAIAENLIHVLDMDGYHAEWFATAGEGLAFLQHNPVALLVLDVGLPDGNGFELCKTIREFSAVPIIFLTARNDEIDRIVGLEIGADDYLAKPFNPRELLARIKSVLRRSNRDEPVAGRLAGRKVSFANWILDTDRQVLIDASATETPLTTSEFKLLAVLLERARMVLSREQLLDLTAGRSAGPMDRTIDNQISRLRRKIEPDVLRPRIIKTVRNGGYSLSCDAEVSA